MLLGAARVIAVLELVFDNYAELRNGRAQEKVTKLRWASKGVLLIASTETRSESGSLSRNIRTPSSVTVIEG
jgi:hypothetical protein